MWLILHARRKDGELESTRRILAISYYPCKHWRRQRIIIAANKSIAMASAKNASLLSRQKVLDIIRGAHLGRGAVGESSDVVERKGLPTRAFALQRQHFASLWPSSFYGQQYDTPLSPADFHSILCERIEKASERIYLASLYVGPAVDPKLYRQEGQLLNSLAKATTQRQDVDVKILLDKSRGLRPVPIQHANDNTVTSITSAEACRQALTGRFFTTEESLTLTTNNNSDHDEGKNPKDHHSVYLHSVLSPLMQKILPNPLDEVAGTDKK